MAKKGHQRYLSPDDVSVDQHIRAGRYTLESWISLFKVAL